MCMFTFANKASPKALVKGVERFECGSCPECLQKKSRKWALRASMEAKVSPGVMVTLTYDTYKYTDGKSIEENPTDPTIPLSKAHCQKFIKRLRKHFRDRAIKYIIAGERGKRTGRAHYHALLFNVTFDDLVKYKTSKRGNIIYKSKTLDKIWKHGICTVDCINLSAKVARYCTKYCAKDGGVDDTFMLFSRGIGEQKLLELFNGKSYWIEGREYSIPREIWQKYIESKYSLYEIKKDKRSNKLRYYGYSRYSPLRKLEDTEKYIYNQAQKVIYDFGKVMRIALSKLENGAISYQRQQEKRELYFHYRDNDILYKKYLSYWKKKSKAYEFNRPSELDRIMMLPDMKYWSYKQKAIRAKIKYIQKRDFQPPRSNIQAFIRFPEKKQTFEKSFAPLTRHYTANDTFWNLHLAELQELKRLRLAIMESRNTFESELIPF